MLIIEERLTDEDYATAEQNGISRRLARQRFNTGMDRDKAISKPMGNTGYIKKLQQEAKGNGIELAVSTISYRKLKGWTDYEIANTERGGHNVAYINRLL